MPTAPTINQFLKLGEPSDMLSCHFSKPLASIPVILVIFALLFLTNTIRVLSLGKALEL